MADESKVSCPPAYVMSEMPEQAHIQIQQVTSRKSKVLFGYAVAITTALVVVVIMGGVYYYRSLDALETTLKKYMAVDNSGTKPVTQNIEIDTVNNIIVFRLSGDSFAPGTMAVLDYTKSLTAIYDPSDKCCYFVPGIDTQIANPVTLNDNLAKNMSNLSSVHAVKYQLGSNYPISDKTMLPKPLMSACTLLPIYWLEKSNEANQTSTISDQSTPSSKKTKRSCYYSRECEETCRKVLFIKWTCTKTCSTVLRCNIG